MYFNVFFLLNTNPDFFKVIKHNKILPDFMLSDFGLISWFCLFSATIKVIWHIKEFVVIKIGHLAQ